MVVTTPKQAQMYDGLIRIALGDIDLVQRAIRIASEGKKSADLDKVVKYIIQHRNTPTTEDDRPKAKVA